MLFREKKWNKIDLHMCVISKLQKTTTAARNEVCFHGIFFPTPNELISFPKSSKSPLANISMYI